jgi:hypothetical protein
MASNEMIEMHETRSILKLLQAIHFMLIAHFVFRSEATIVVAITCNRAQ